MKKTLKGILATYALAYGIGTGWAVYDYATEHHKWLEKNMKNELAIQNFKTTIGGKERQLTLVGEIHIYNRAEVQFSKEFVKQFDLVLYEGTESLSVGEVGWELSRLPQDMINLSFYGFATDRLDGYSYLEDAAKAEKKPVLKLEEITGGPMNALSTKTKMKLFLESTEYAAIGPLVYKSAKDEISKNKQSQKETVEEIYTEYYSGKKELSEIVVGRDPLMADQAVKYLHEHPEKKVLIVVGKAHFLGMVKQLESRIKIEPLDEIHSP